MFTEHFQFFIYTKNNENDAAVTFTLLACLVMG